MAHVYILTNDRQTVLYVGVTSNLTQRLAQHHTTKEPSFTKRYNVHKLIYVEEYTDITFAIAREKALKGASRITKLKLILSQNPNWQDLTPHF